MSGRISNQLQIYKSVEKNFINYPKYLIDWYFHLKANDISATTCKDYINKIIRFLESISTNWNDIIPANISVDNVIQYFINIKVKKDTDGNVIGETSYSYRQSVWSCFNNFFEYLYNNNWTNDNIFKKANIKRPKNNDLQRINQKRILLSKDDFKNILKAVEDGVGSKKSRAYQKRFHNRDKSIMLIFMTTGIRETALREIDVDDINLETGELTVVDKRHKFHTYTLDLKTVGVIKDWLIDRYFILGGIKHDALFISRDQNRISSNSIAELVDKYASAALGYHISPHKLRSGLASILYNEKRDIEYVRRVIGHSSSTTTQRYIVTDNKEREEAANLITQMIM